MAKTSKGYKINKHPIAQSFNIDSLNGVYVTKVELFFSAKEAAFPVSLQLRPMDGGVPHAEEIIPGSQVVVSGSSVNISSDATAATAFVFDEPIYLKGLTDYAMVITADSANYKVFVAQTNEFLVGSTERRVDRQPTLGSLFYSQNSVTFTPIQNQDLTFKLYKASFPHTEATIVMKNAALPKELLTNNPITTTATSTTVTVTHEGHGFVVGDIINLENHDSNGVGGINYNSLAGNRTVTKVDATGYQFVADSAADSSVIGGGANVLGTKNIPYHLIYPHIQTLVPQNTRIYPGIKPTTGKSYAGSETAFQKQSNFTPIGLNENNIGDVPYVVANAASETSNLGSGVKSLEMSIIMSTGDSNVAPMFDMQRASASLIGYLIDKQDSSATAGFNVPISFVNETSASGGSAASKHIMKPVTLEQDAVGLKIIATANRPAAADFQFFFRTAAGDQNIEDQSFTLLTEDTNNPSDDNESVFREYRYLAGKQGGDLPAFTQFQIKVVMRSTNAAKPPVFKDIRVIALSV